MTTTKLSKKLLIPNRPPAWHLGTFIAMSLLTQPATAAVQISFTDLHPAGATSSQLNALTDSQQVGYITISGVNYAGFWTGTAASFINLRPGTLASAAYAASGSQQAGSVSFSGMASHAALWASIPGSYVDLNPAGITLGSRVEGMCGSQQVGSISLSAGLHAALWSGTPDSFVDLNPGVSSGSRAYASNGSQQAGGVTISGYGHAAFWSGTADSFVDLHPAVASSSAAYALSDTQQVGSISPGGLVNYAALWSGTAASFINLNPFLASNSIAYAVSAGQQAGYATIGGVSHAALWFGTADSFTDLHSALGTSYSSSIAKAILIQGDTTYVAGYAKAVSSGNNHAIVWTIRVTPPLPPILITGKQQVGLANVLTLTWTNNGVPCLLESAGTASGSWSTAPAPWATNNGWVSTRITNTASQQFYRLRGN